MDFFFVSAWQTMSLVFFFVRFRLVRNDLIYSNHNSHFFFVLYHDTKYISYFPIHKVLRFGINITETYYTWRGGMMASTYFR